MKINTPQVVVTLLVSLSFLSQTFGQSEKARIGKYVELYKDLAIAEMVRTGIPASITLAQGVLETGFGQSDLALNANNHFGIKCKADWTGETILHDDDAKSECFRKYSSVQESYKDHSDFLRTRPNYASLFLLDPLNYTAWARGLKKAGYATSPTYSERLIKIIEENSLQQYTAFALGEKRVPADQLLTVADPYFEKKTKTAIPQPSRRNLSDADAKNINPVLQNAVVISRAGSYPSGIFSINGAKVLFAEAGTSLFAIANNNRIAYNKLLEFNDLSKVDILQFSQLIFLERKAKKGFSETHIVAEDETVYDICQAEGVQLSSLLEFNHLKYGMVPAVGEKLFLKYNAKATPKLSVVNKKEYAASMR